MAGPITCEFHGCTYETCPHKYVEPSKPVSGVLWKSLYKRQCPLCRGTIKRGDMVTKVAESCGIELRNVDYSDGTGGEIPFTGQRIVHRDCAPVAGHTMWTGYIYSIEDAGDFHYVCLCEQTQINNALHSINYYYTKDPTRCGICHKAQECHGRGAPKEYWCDLEDSVHRAELGVRVCNECMWIGGCARGGMITAQAVQERDQQRAQLASRGGPVWRVWPDNVEQEDAEYLGKIRAQ